MNEIFIEGLRVKTHIGLHAWEKAMWQTVIVDLQIQVDIEQAAAENDIAKTINYQQVAERIRDFFTTGDFHLVENAAQHLATILRDEFKVSWLRLRIAKPNVFADIDAVGIVIERGLRH